MAVTLKLPFVVIDDDYLVRVSEENPGYQFEREENGTLTVTPNVTMGGARSGEAFSQLYDFALRSGGRAFISSVGFSIGPYRAIKSPDASWVSTAGIAGLTEAEAAGFWPLSPDVTIKVRPNGDDFDETIAKIEFSIEHGTRWRSIRLRAKSSSGDTRRRVCRSTSLRSSMLDRSSPRHYRTYGLA